MNKILKIYSKNKEIINYLIVGGMTTFVGLVTKWLLLFTVLDAKNAVELQLAVVISWILAVTFAYITNRKFVFESKSVQIFKEIMSFTLSRVVTLIIEMLLTWIFITLLKMNSNFMVMFWTLTIQVLVIVLNYIFSKFFVFKKN